MGEQKYFWTAYFDDNAILAEEKGVTLEEYEAHKKQAKLLYLDFNDGSYAYGVDLVKRRFGIEGTWFSLAPDSEKLKGVKAVLEREGDLYIIGLEAKTPRGKPVRQVIYLS